MSNELNNDVNLNNDIILLEDKLANLKMRRVRYHELYFIYLSRKLNGKKKREIKTALEKVFNIKLKTNRHLFYSTTYNFHASPLDDIPVIRIISVNNAGIVLHIFGAFSDIDVKNTLREIVSICNEHILQPDEEPHNIHVCGLNNLPVPEIMDAGFSISN